MEQTINNTIAEPATSKQLWALFCITKKDHRNLGLTKEAASQLIQEASEQKAHAKDKWQEIYDKAVAAAKEAGEKHTPTPMIVQQHANVLDDNSPVTQQWHAPMGVCGFASVRIKPGNSAFALWATKKGYCSKNVAYHGGKHIRFPNFGQCYEKNVKAAGAFARILNDNGILAYME